MRHRGFPNAGGGISGNLPVGRVHHDGDVWGIDPNRGSGFFVRSGYSDPFGGLRTQFLPATEDNRGTRSARVGASGVGVRCVGGNSLFRGALADRLCPDQHLHPVCLVPGGDGAGDLVADPIIILVCRQGWEKFLLKNSPALVRGG